MATNATTPKVEAPKVEELRKHQDKPEPATNGEKVSVKFTDVKLNEFMIAKLDTVVRYQFKDRLALFGALSIEKEMDFLRADVVGKMIDSRHKALEDQIKNRQSADTTAYFRLLISKGWATDKAYREAYGIENPADSKQAEVKPATK